MNKGTLRFTVTPQFRPSPLPPFPGRGKNWRNLIFTWALAHVNIKFRHLTEGGGMLCAG